MKNLLPIILLFSASSLLAVAQKRSYTDYRLVRTFPNNAEQEKFINKLEETNVNADILGTVLVESRKAIDLVLPPSVLQEFLSLFNENAIEYKVLSDNIQEFIDKETESMKKNQNSRSIVLKYARYPEIMNFIEEMVDNNTDIASSHVIGTTYGRRLLKYIRLRSGTPSKAVWIDCGIHAREWVTQSSCVFIIDQLVKEYRDSNTEIMDIFDKYEILILPMLNPDGYEYSHETERLWRKNRRVPPSGSTCYGVDLNRNFPIDWMGAASSADPCSNTHAGPFPESEPETQALMNFLMSRKGEWEAYFTLHNYGCWWLTPFGYTSTLPLDNDLIMTASNIGTQAMNNFNGSVFIAKPTGDPSPISGLSTDWAYTEVGISYSFAFELRPTSRGDPDFHYLFALPEDRMPIVATEAYLGIKAFLHYVSQL